MPGQDGYIKVGFDAMGQMVTDINRGSGQMATQLTDLDNAAAPMVATWNGAAQAAYAERQAAWRGAADEINQILNAIRGGVDQSLADYISTEQGIARSFGG